MIRVTIEGPEVSAGPSWEALDDLIRSLLPETSPPRGALIRIARPDGKANYRAAGEYHCTFRHAGDDIAIVLQVSRFEPVDPRKPDPRD